MISLNVTNDLYVKVNCTAEFCKCVEKCRYFHSSEICQRHLENMICNEKDCNKRHKFFWKCFQKEVGCRRNNCDFLHVTLADGDGKQTAHKEPGFKCQGCDSVYPEENYVVTHEINYMHLWFCLNFDEWIKDKTKVLNKDWNLFDQNGALRRDV